MACLAGVVKGLDGISLNFHLNFPYDSTNNCLQYPHKQSITYVMSILGGNGTLPGVTKWEGPSQAF